ncbi:hypothetical protein N0V82_002769 [Gnomoniopsis sp. IMI 355080]|nr:hypothetical protein N0V82_002769 [Gnomoniopsis sp. IMI 355080]
MATSLTSYTSETFSERAFVVLVAIIAGALAFLGPWAIKTIRLASIPWIGSELGNEEKRRVAYLQGARKIYYAGYEKTIADLLDVTDANVVLVSPKYLPELNKLADSVVSFEAAVDDAMETKYTKIQSSVPIIPHIVKSKLTPSLTRLNPTIASEAADALELELPSEKFADWQEVNIHDKLCRIVGMISGRLFIGPEACRSEEYLDAAINYTMDVMKAQRAVQSMRPWLRPFMAHRLPEIKNLYKRIDEADAFMRPLVEERKKLYADKSSASDVPEDFLQWMLETNDTTYNFARVQLGLTFAAIHTTVLTATNAFYNLAAVDESVLAELQDEAKQALSENDWVFTSKCLQSMKKLDSFLRETLRMNPASMASFQRKLLKDIRLSNGQFIPAGATIEVPAVAVNNDPELFPNPEQFDPFRFSRIRDEAKADGSDQIAALNQFVSVNQTSLTFGFGRHACPGRFFAANEIKMILANVLMRYEVRMPGGRTERYPNMEFAAMLLAMIWSLFAALHIGLVAGNAGHSAALTGGTLPNVADIMSKSTAEFESYPKGNLARVTVKSSRTGIFPTSRPNRSQWNCTITPVLTWGDRDNGGNGVFITNADSTNWQAFFLYHDMCDSIPFKYIWIGPGLTRFISLPPLFEGRISRGNDEVSLKILCSQFQTNAPL